MENYENIDFAITETLLAHPDFTNSINYTIYKNIVDPNGISLINFTSQNGARRKMKNVSQSDLLEFILIEVVKGYNAMMYFYHNNEEMQKRKTPVEKLKYLQETFPNYPQLQDAISKIANPKINSVIHFTNNPNNLLTIVDAVIQNRYQTASVYKNYIDRFGKGLTYVAGFGEQDLIQKIAEDSKKASVAKHVQINRRVANKCLKEVMSGAQLKNQRNEYGLEGDLYASQDIGKRRHNQEDSVIILTHPENPDFKLLAVSDGMGGVELGDRASQYTVQQLAKWFESLSKDYFYYPLELQGLLNSKIKEISNDIYNKYNKEYQSIRAGATLATAVVTENETITSTVGDSRVYSILNGKLTLLSRDESRVWPLGIKPHEITAAELDELRFHKENNLITRCIGDDLKYSRIQTLITPNTSYDRLLLFSDGVTDLLSQERIRFISSQFPKDLVTKALVDEAISMDAIRQKGSSDIYNGKIVAGKDNATAAMYARR